MPLASIQMPTRLFCHKWKPSQALVRLALNRSPSTRHSKVNEVVSSNEIVLRGFLEKGYMNQAIRLFQNHGAV